jgi:hypothetical protein
MVKMPNDYLSDPRWIAECDARRRVEKAVRAEEKRMISSQEFMEVALAVQKREKAQGREINMAAAMTVINDMFPGSYATAAGYQPQAPRNATEAKFQKAVQSAMIGGDPYAVAVQKVFSGDAALFKEYLRLQGVPV